MINANDIISYEQPALFRNEKTLVIAPHKLLHPYIANYTFTIPDTMPEQQTILPSASSTLVYSVSSKEIVNGLRGVSTKPTVIGSFAKQFVFMFLIEFHAGGLYPFIKVDQCFLTDAACSFEDLSKILNRKIIEAYYLSNSIYELKHKLDMIFLQQLDTTIINTSVAYTMKLIQNGKGLMQVKNLANEVFYSEKQLNRLFQKNIGTSIKTFSRIVRINHAAHLLKQSIAISQIAEQLGHYDTAHFAHDFKDIYGLTPIEYVQKMSLFYNDPFKLSGL